MLNQGRSDVPPPPARLVYPEDLFHGDSSERRKLMKHFVTTMENYLGAKAERIQLSTLWDEHTPDEAKGRGLDEYIGHVSPILASAQAHAR